MHHIPALKHATKDKAAITLVLSMTSLTQCIHYRCSVTDYQIKVSTYFLPTFVYIQARKPFLYESLSWGTYVPTEVSFLSINTYPHHSILTLYCIGTEKVSC